MALAKKHDLYDPYRFTLFKARRGKASLRNPDEVYRDGVVAPVRELIIGWPLPFFVADQFGCITNDAELRRTQGIRYYAGDAKLAEDALLA
eukprot:13889490-Alexandrium_andersonii.AAC.1